MTWIYAGTVALTNGSKDVTGTGTAWAGGDVLEGDQFNTPTGPYEVESVASNGSLKLVRAYAGPSVNNQTYSIVPTQGRMVPFAKQLSTLMTSLGAMKDAYAAGDLAEVGDLLSKVDTTQLAKATGANTVGYQRESAAILRGVGSKLDQFLTFYEYMSDAEIADAKSQLPALDHTVSMQKTIDRNKGCHIIAPSDGVFQGAGIFMEGPSYSGTSLDFQGSFLLRKRPAANSTLFQGAWLGFLLRNCEGNKVNFRGNANRSVQPSEEHIYLMGLAGVRRLEIPSFRGFECRGDGLYIGQYNWNSESANSDGITIGLFDVTNTAPDGRNGLSVISCDNLAITTFRSINVGALMNGVTQPGGFDIEPDHSYQSCKNITIGSLLVVTAGTSGLAIAGRPGYDVTNNVTIGTATVVNTCLPSVQAENGAIAATNNHTLIIGSATDVMIQSYQGKFTAAYGDAVIVGDSKRVNLTGAVSHVREGARIGGDALDAIGGGAGVSDSDINLKVSDTIRFCIRTGKITNVDIRGSTTVPVPGFYASSLCPVIAISSPGITFVQKDVRYSFSVAVSPYWVRTYRNDPSYPVVFDNTVIQNCDLSGTGWGDVVYQTGDMKVPRYNVRGVTHRSSPPPNAANLFVPGQLFVNTAATTVGAPTGWVHTGTEVRVTGVVA